MVQRKVNNILRIAITAAAWMTSATCAAAQRSPHITAPADVPVVMLSDLHFDPMHDPAKVPLLAKAPIEQWPFILSSPAEPGLESRFAGVQKTCNSKEAADTPYPLLASALTAAKANAGSAGFVIVSGDLLVHDLDCRYRAAMGLPENTTDDESPSAAFAEKTTVFVMRQIDAAFPRIPVYLALGNNDSRCNHNRLDSHDAYLKASSSAVLDGLRGVRAAEKAAATTTYESAGYYAVTMPPPMVQTRLIVVNDIYMMPKYANCEADETDRKGELEQAAWLQKELDSARARKQHVWLVGHLPPAVNPDASLSKNAAFCATGQAVRFQTTDDLANQLQSHADVVTLGIFGHTHMDELHLLQGAGGAVPIKVVASVTPVSGNLPSFTVGTVNTASATLTDYTVYKSSNATGMGTTWQQEYGFDETYHVTSFSSAALSNLITRLRSDTGGTGTESRTYQEHFLKGAGGKKLSPSWKGYVCSLDHASASSFKQCVCSTQ